MMSMDEKNDWKELIGILRKVESNVVSPRSKGNGSSFEFQPCREALKSFQNKASKLGITELRQAGKLLERYMEEQIESKVNAEPIGVFSFALTALLEQMERVQKGNGEPSLRVDEVMEILGVSMQNDVADTLSDDDIPPDPILAYAAGEKEFIAEPPAEPASLDDLDAEVSDLMRLEMTVRQLGGEVSVVTEGDNPKKLILRFEASRKVPDQIETLLSAGAPQVHFASQLSQSGNRFDEVLGTIREFMMTLSKGNCFRAQDILLSLAEQQHQAGLYKEIGGLARDLHNSLKNFMGAMDPHLREMVEERIPDTGNRLERILELTENAANTTIDHVEAMQRRNESERKKVDDLEKIVGKLRAIGEQAQIQVSKGQEVLKELRSSLEMNHEDLIVVLTAQDYQDLTGQIILKIIQLLKDLEVKLASVIGIIGMKNDDRKEGKAVLCGPAHKIMAESLRSQDDVDSLLAEFGF